MPRIRVRLLADGVIEDAIRERLDPPAWNTALAALHSVAIALDEIHRNAYYAVQEAIDDYPVYVDETHAYGRIPRRIIDD